MPPSREGAISVAFAVCPSVCPFVCLFVAYIGNNSTIQRPCVPNQGLRTSKSLHGWRTRISHRRHDLQGQWSRSQGHVMSLSHVGPKVYKSKMESRSITKIDRTVPHVMYYISHQFQCQKVTGRLTQTHKTRHIFQTVKPKNFKVGKRMEDVDLHQRQAPRPPKLKFQVTTSHDMSDLSRWDPSKKSTPPQKKKNSTKP